MRSRNNNIQNRANPLSGKSPHNIRFIPIRLNHKIFKTSYVYPFDTQIYMTTPKNTVHIVHHHKTDCGVESSSLYT